MKTQQYVHIHALLFELRAYFEREYGRSADAFANYDTQPVRPNHVHRGKQAHKSAVELLLSGLKHCLGKNPAARTPMS